MRLLIVSLYELKQFLQIILWIAVPVTLAAILIVTFLHYRRRRKEAESGQVVAGPYAGSDSPADSPEDTEAYQNMLELHKKYVSEIEIGRQEHEQLKDEFRKLEKKYLEQIAKAGSQARPQYASSFFQDAFQQKESEIQQLQNNLILKEEALRYEKEQRKIISAEMNKQGNLLKDMEMLATQARQDTEDLRQSANEHLLGSQESLKRKEVEWQEESTKSQLQIRQLKDEIAALRDRLVDQESARDVIEEKNSQIGFLQQQLEQRIKHYHQLEFQNREENNRLSELQAMADSMEQQMGLLEEKLQGARGEQAMLHETLDSKSVHIAQLESNLEELQEHNRHSQEQLGNHHHTIYDLNQRLLLEGQKAKELEQKLEFSSHLLMKIYTELARSLGRGSLVPPPGELRPPERKLDELVFVYPESTGFPWDQEG